MAYSGISESAYRAKAFLADFCSGVPGFRSALATIVVSTKADCAGLAVVLGEFARLDLVQFVAESGRINDQADVLQLHQSLDSLIMFHRRLFAQ